MCDVIINNIFSKIRMTKKIIILFPKTKPPSAYKNEGGKKENGCLVFFYLFTKKRVLFDSRSPSNKMK